MMKWFAVSFWFRVIVSFLVISLLSACIAPQTRLLLEQPTTNNRFLIDGVPFYPQQQFFCGPTTIAEVLNFYGESYDPLTLAPQLFIPEREGSLQIEMVATVRQAGFVAYQDKLTLQELIQIVATNTPVIVLQNNGLSWYPQWHYAVVIGYDLGTESLLLHTGLSAAKAVDLSLFERTWKRADQWSLIPLPVSKAPMYLKEIEYLQASNDLLVTGKQSQAVEAMMTASDYWQLSHLPRLLLGNYYLEKDSQRAKSWFSAAYRLAPENGPLLNNYAYLLSQMNCFKEARMLIHKALKVEPNNTSYQATLRAIDESQKHPTLESQNQCEV